MATRILTISSGSGRFVVYSDASRHGLGCVPFEAYRIALPLSMSKVHNVFHVLTLRKYVFDPSHVVE